MTDDPSASATRSGARPEPGNTSSSVLIVLFGLWLMAGAIYQVVEAKRFPAFPIQIDGVFGIFESLFGRGAGIYISSLVAGALGLAALWMGMAGIRGSRPRRAGGPGDNQDGG